MKTFTITFRCGRTLHSARVKKCSGHPVRYEVSGVMPFNRRLPVCFSFVSNGDDDQLICHSYNEDNRLMLVSIGEAIFKACQLKKMPVHQ